MAETYNNVIAGQTRSYPLAHGLKFAMADITIGSTTDYSTTSGSEGLTISAAQFGLSTVLEIVHGSLRAVADGDLNPAFWELDHDTGKIRGFQAGGDEIAGADFTGGDILRLSVLGI